MPKVGERTWLKSVAGYAVFIAGVAAAAMIAYDAVSEGTRQTVIRVASTFAAGAVLLHQRVRWRESIGEPGPNRIIVPEEKPTISQFFSNLHHDVRASLNSRRSFEAHLHPRLRELAQNSDVTIDSLAPRPRTWSKRGPTLVELTRIIERLERET